MKRSHYLRFLYPLLIATPLAAQTAGEKPPFHLPDTVDLQQDIVYARYGERALHLDLYLPKQGSALPAVVWVHGGGWSGGDKNRFRRQAALMAAHGFAAACIEYRLSGEATFPAAIYDVKASVRWLRANAKQYRINPDKIGAAGGSAGAHLVALLGVTPNVAEFEGPGGNPGVSSRVQAVVAIYPPTDLIPAGKKNPTAQNGITRFLGATYAENPSLWAKASPVTYVSKDAPPFFFLHGDDDKLVDYHQSLEMADKLKAAGASAEVFIAKGAGHGFANGPEWFQQTLDRIEAFFTRTLK
jgi:acetyl esterase/lipase